MDPYRGGGGSALSAFRLTPAVKWILIASVVIFLLELVFGQLLRFGEAIQVLVLSPQDVARGYVWQLATYAWLHADPSHLLLNLLGVWIFGVMLEGRWGTRAFLKFYVLCGIFAGVAVVVVGLLFDLQRPTLGASGAIYGLMVAFGILFAEVPIYLLGILPMKGKTFVLLTLGITLLYSLFAIAGGGAGGVSLEAHLGGMAAGALLVTGHWRPSRWTAALKRWNTKRRMRRFRVVRDRDRPSGGNGAGGVLH